MPRRDEPVAAPTLSINSFADLIALAAEKRDITTKMALERDVQSDPLVQAVLSRFPGAKVVGVTQNGPDQAEQTSDASSYERED